MPSIPEDGKVKIKKSTFIGRSMYDMCNKDKCEVEKDECI
jgi:hypothetical protein